MDKEWNIIRQKTYGGIYGESFISVAQVDTDSFVVAGGTVSIPGTLDTWIINIDGKGNLLH